MKVVGLLPGEKDSVCYMPGIVLGTRIERVAKQSILLVELTLLRDR